MLPLVISIEGAWDRTIVMTTNFFQRCFAQCLVVSVFKVSSNLDKYLPRHSVFGDCLESDLHHMILSILIDFIQDRAFFVPFFRLFFNSLNLNNSGTRNGIKNSKRKFFWLLKDFQIGQ